jgi:hypothetical protein
MRDYAVASKALQTPLRNDIMTNESSNQPGRSGNLINDQEKASETDRKRGQQSQQGSRDQPNDKSQQGGSEKSGGQQQGSSENFANDPEKASEAGRKGGEHSQGGK